VRDVALGAAVLGETTAARRKSPRRATRLVGDWSKLLVGIREDISFDLSDQASYGGLDEPACTVAGSNAHRPFPAIPLPERDYG
jgi:hypothetical protein